jgi:outer membrane protein OmpA-like peptidoglycan-associated protein
VADAPERGSQVQPVGWRLVYAGVILALVVLVAFAITQFTGGQAPRWDEDELTPQKYKTTLQKEKEMLASRMSEGDDTVAEVDSSAKPDRIAVESRQINTGTAGQPGTGSEGNESDAHSLQDVDARTGGEQAVEELKPLPLIKEKIIIQFRLNSNEIEDQSYTVLDRIAAYLAHNSHERVSVKGYTDASGPISYNESVSRFRANAVKSYMIGKGAKPQQIAVFGMGAKNPIAPNSTVDGRRRNRRVEIEFTVNQGP